MRDNLNERIAFLERSNKRLLEIVADSCGSHPVPPVASWEDSASEADKADLFTVNNRLRDEISKLKNEFDNYYSKSTTNIHKYKCALELIRDKPREHNFNWVEWAKGVAIEVLR